MNFMNLSVRTYIIIVVIGVLLIAGGFIFATAIPLIFPEQASAEAQQVDELFRVLLVIGGAIFLLVQGLLAYSVWRFRARAGDRSDGIVLHGNNVLEIVWTAVPAVIVFVLTILSYNVFWSLQAPKDNEMLVRVDGRRFNWAFSYDTDVPMPNDPSSNVVVKSADLHTYLGQPVVLEMQAQDVIHSFWVPAFRIKQDLIPGRVTTVRFTPVEVPGEEYPASYPVRCAELCGANHGIMITSVIVHRDQADYQAWLDAQIETILNPPPDPVEFGRLVLTDPSFALPCYSCHILNIDDPDTPWTGAIGPALNGVADRAAGPRSTATGLSAADYLYQSIQDPTAYLVPGFGPLMPPNLVQDECQLQAIVAYLCTASETSQAQCTIDTEQYAQQCTGPGGAPAGESTAEATAAVESTAEATSAVSEATVEASSEPAAMGTAVPTEEATAGT